MKTINTGYTRKQLIELTGIAYYNLTHLRLTDKLPILKQSTGRGVATIYHPDAVEVINAYLRRLK
jgi:hypothetical protein